MKKKSLAQKIEKEVVATPPKGGKKKKYAMDLRIHTPSSLGYFGIEGIDTAPALVRLARVKGLDMIAVTDFYSAGFVDRLVEASVESGVTVIPGTTIRCALDECNEVILVCLFPENHTRSDIETFLNDLKVPESRADKDFIVPLPFREILEIIKAHNGQAIPSRMDKTPHQLTVISSLVDDYGFRAFDLAYGDSSDLFHQRWPKIKFQLFSFSNASALAQVGSRKAKLALPCSGFEGIRQMFQRESIGA